jgi:hypothetical protein
MIALASVGLFAGRIFSQNAQLKTAANMSAIATLITGALLIVGQSTSLSHACLSGTVYLAAVVALSRVATLRQA